jgi:two-component system sensor histidine kinase/response regulator
MWGKKNDDEKDNENIVVTTREPTEEEAIDIEEMRKEVAHLQEIYTAKTDLVSISAHQIRTSLSGLKWILKMFIDGDLGELDPEQENLMRKAFDSNERAISLVSELLRFNKTEDTGASKYKFEKVDVVEVIEQTVFDFSGEAHIKGIEVIFLKEEGVPRHATADKEKLRTILQNIIENALKYSDAHGKVFITLKKDGDFLQVSVKDKGVGISDEGKERIFEKFYRDKEAKKKEPVGSGIGLFTIKKIVEDMAGKIWFESIEGEGTTFFFTVPVHP